MQQFSIGQQVLWKSAKGYTPPAGEIGIVDAIWPDTGYARLTLDAPDAPPEFNGKCSMCMPLAELEAA